jgi:hypothetical protein
MVLAGTAGCRRAEGPTRSGKGHPAAQARAPERLLIPRGKTRAFRPLAHSSGPPTIAGMNRNRRSRRRWRDRTPAEQGLVIAGATVQFGLAAAAWTDLARRARRQVRGPKWRWAALIGVNYVRPIAYFRWGRRCPA